MQCRCAVLMAVAGLVLTSFSRASGQASRWLSAQDSTARLLIANERAWSAEACTHTLVSDRLLADDFQGTSHSGIHYSKAREVSDVKSDTSRALSCDVLDATVHMFGDSTAVVYGTTRIVRPASGGATVSRCLIWTDTWLRRARRWQLVAGQDGFVECK